MKSYSFQLEAVWHKNLKGKGCSNGLSKLFYLRHKKVPLEMVSEVPAWTCTACITLLCKGLLHGSRRLVLQVEVRGFFEIFFCFFRSNLYGNELLR